MQLVFEMMMLTRWSLLEELGLCDAWKELDCFHLAYNLVLKNYQSFFLLNNLIKFITSALLLLICSVSFIKSTKQGWWCLRIGSVRIAAA